TPGTSTNINVSYAGLKLDQVAYTASITVQDANGLIGTGSATFDTFNPTNFTWEAEEFDHDSGQFIDNPDYTTFASATSYYGLDSVAGVDTFTVNNGGSSVADYRAGSSDPSRTQTGPATGELLRQKFLNNIVDPTAVDHAIGFWSSSDWENYTKTFP